METRARTIEAVNERIDSLEEEISKLDTARIQPQDSLVAVAPPSPATRLPLPQPEPFGALTGQKVKTWLWVLEVYFVLAGNEEDPTRVKFAQLLFRNQDMVAPTVGTPHAGKIRNVPHDMGRS